MSDIGRKPLPGWIVVGCSLLFFPALIAVFVAAASAGLFCIDGCSNNQVTLAITQLVVAAFGLLPVALTVLAAVRGSARLAAAMLGLALGTYAIWGVLNAALSHGWSNVP